MAFVELFGEKLLARGSEQDTAEVLAGKSHVMIYFSARWCPQCSAYSPILSKAYETSAEKGDVAIILVSSDRDQAAFDESCGSISFHALPYADRDRMEQLSQKFGIKDLPSLVLLDGEGNLKDGNVRGRHDEFLPAVAPPAEASSVEPTAEPSNSDPTVEPRRCSPPASQVFVELFGEKLLTKEGARDTTEVLAGRADIIIYFGAKDTPGCAPHVEALSKLELAERLRGRSAIVLVSFDSDQAAFDEYWGSLPFYAMPYSEKGRADRMAELFGIKDVPRIVFLDAQGNRKKLSGASANEAGSCVNGCADCCIA